MNDEIEACPICGNHTAKLRVTRSGSWLVQCQCAVRAIKEDAIAAWNSRHQEAKPLTVERIVKTMQDWFDAEEIAMYDAAKAIHSALPPVEELESANQAYREALVKIGKLSSGGGRHLDDYGDIARAVLARFEQDLCGTA